MQYAYKGSAGNVTMQLKWGGGRSGPMANQYGAWSTYRFIS